MWAGEARTPAKKNPQRARGMMCVKSSISSRGPCFMATPYGSLPNLSAYLVSQSLSSIVWKILSCAVTRQGSGGAWKDLHMSFACQEVAVTMLYTHVLSGQADLQCCPARNKKLHCKARHVRSSMRTWVSVAADAVSLRLWRRLGLCKRLCCSTNGLSKSRGGTVHAADQCWQNAALLL